MPASRERIGGALQLLGDQWVLLILQQAFAGERRFSGWRDRLSISEAVLAARLRLLVDAGVLSRVPYRDEHRTREEYRLTEAGLALWQVLVAIWAWEVAWVPGRTEQLPALVHTVCGQSCRPLLGCAACGTRDVRARETTLLRAPGRSLADASPPRRFRRSGWEAVADRPELFFPETMAILGDRWASALMAAAFLGVRRFRDLERELGIGPSMLSARLGELVERGVLDRVELPDSQAVEYRLTGKGREFFPVVSLIVDWGQRFLPAAPSTLSIAHPACGQPFVPCLTCEACGGVLHRREVRFAPILAPSQ